jgi:hypothetical protein
MKEKNHTRPPLESLQNSVRECDVMEVADAGEKTDAPVNPEIEKQQPAAGA